MKRYEMIKSKQDFSFIIKNGRFFKNQLFVIYYINDYNQNAPHFGIAVSSKLGKAHIRNRLKRQVRVIIDKHKEQFKKNKNYIIMIRKDCLKSSFKEMDLSLMDLMKGKK